MFLFSLTFTLPVTRVILFLLYLCSFYAMLSYMRFFFLLPYHSLSMLLSIFKQQKSHENNTSIHILINCFPWLYNTPSTFIGRVLKIFFFLILLYHFYLCFKRSSNIEIFNKLKSIKIFTKLNKSKYTPSYFINRKKFF